MFDINGCVSEATLVELRRSPMPRRVNLTPHDVRIRLPYWKDLDHNGNPAPVRGDLVLPSEGVARVSTVTTKTETLFVEHTEARGGIAVIPTVRTGYGAVVGLPDPVDGVAYVVSLLVLAALGGTRADVLAPATGPEDGAIRDERGQVFAVTRLVRP